MSAVYLGKILINCWRLALRINKDGTTKMRKQRNEKNEKTDILHKKWRKQKKAGTVSQVIDGGGAQVGTSERPGMCQPSPLRKNIQVLYVNNVKRTERGRSMIVGVNCRPENIKSPATMLLDQETTRTPHA